MTAVLENLDPLLRALGTTVLILVISAAALTPAPLRAARATTA